MASDPRNWKRRQACRREFSSPTPEQPQPTTLSVVEDRELWSVIEACLLEMPRAEALYFRLYHLHGLRQNDIAARTGVTRSAVAVGLMRARRSLQRLLRQRGIRSSVPFLLAVSGAAPRASACNPVSRATLSIPHRSGLASLLVLAVAIVAGALLRSEPGVAITSEATAQAPRPDHTTDVHVRPVDLVLARLPAQSIQDRIQLTDRTARRSPWAFAAHQPTRVMVRNAFAPTVGSQGETVYVVRIDSTTNRSRLAAISLRPTSGRPLCWLPSIPACDYDNPVVLPDSSGLIAAISLTGTFKLYIIKGNVARPRSLDDPAPLSVSGPSHLSDHGPVLVPREQDGATVWDLVFVSERARYNDLYVARYVGNGGFDAHSWATPEPLKMADRIPGAQCVFDPSLVTDATASTSIVFCASMANRDITVWSSRVLHDHPLKTLLVDPREIQGSRLLRRVSLGKRLLAMGVSNGEERVVTLDFH